MIRNIVLIIGMFLLFACEEEQMISDIPEMSTDAETVPVSFNVALQMDGNTEYVPMSRAGEQPIITTMSAAQPYILMKKVDEKWYIDRIDKWQLSGTSATLKVTLKTQLNPLSLMLTPGTYRLAVFLNGNGLVWDKSFKVGSFVADASTADEDFPCLATYAKETTYNHQSVLLGKDIFSGYEEFTVNKNDNLHTDAPKHSFNISLTRKVGQIQFLLEKTSATASFSTTSYTIDANLRAQSPSFFCEGLNVLGLPYFNKENPCTELKFCCSTQFLSGWRTDKKGRQYQMAETGSTIFSPYLLADPNNTKGVDFEICDIWISGQVENYEYQYEGTISKVLKANHVCGVAFEARRDSAPPLSTYVELMIDENGHPVPESDFLLPPYYIWNPSLFVEPEK